jgi:hypothetical protein
MMIPKRVKPDAKGRIALGSLTKGISSFSVNKKRNGSIVLEPFVEIPAQEKWLFENKQALNKVKKGLTQVNGDLLDKGDFTQYIDDDE